MNPGYKLWRDLMKKDSEKPSCSNKKLSVGFFLLAILFCFLGCGHLAFFSGIGHIAFSEWADSLRIFD